MKNYNFAIAVLFLCTLSITGYSQTDKPSKDDVISFPKYAIGISPSALINTVSGVQISQDYGITDRLNATLETGYLFFRNKSTDLNGYRIEIGMQYLIARTEFVGLTMGINYIHRFSYEEAEVRSFQAFGADITQDISRELTLDGLEFNMSIPIKISPRFRAELGAGAGYALFDVNLDMVEVNGPAFDTYADTGNSFLTLRGIDNIIVASFNINLSYILFE